MNSTQRGQWVVTVRRHHAHGWAVSTLIHICGIGGALMLMAELKRLALPQPFRFDVALVQPYTSQAVSEPAPPTLRRGPRFRSDPSSDVSKRSVSWQLHGKFHESSRRPLQSSRNR